MSRLLTLALCLLLSGLTHAQSRTIRGIVIDASDGRPQPGVNVGTRQQPGRTITDANGRFTLTTAPGTVTLVASFIGFLRQEIVVKRGRDTLTIKLQPDTRTLNEVVVTGYKTESRKAVTGSVSTIHAAGRTSVAYSPPGPVPRQKGALFREEAHVLPPDRQQQAGQLTAGEIHDYSKWTLWQDIPQTDLGEFRHLWRQAPAERYSVQLVTPDGFPVIDAPVRLLDNQGQVRWQARSDNTGRAELWNNLFRMETDSAKKPREKLVIEAVVGGKTYLLNRPNRFGTGQNSLTIGQTCQGAPQAVDVAFVVDATGSMGDEITYLKAELADVISRAKEAAPGSTIRLGSVFYRDHVDEYLTRHHDFSDQPDSTVAFIKKQSAAGGGDFPEAVDTALSVALTQLSWSKTAKTRLLFLVLDAPPHDDDASKASLQRSVVRAAAMGIRIIPIAASGIDKSTEYLLRAMALSTNGTYLFLTDDSGIGDSHIKPTTDQYTVEKLNNLLVRVITKFTQTPDCKPIANKTAPARYTEQGQPVDTTAQSAKAGTEPRFRFFPNPTRDYLTIESRDNIRELYVMDITGKVILRETPNTPNARLDMLPYPTGTYLFRFDVGEAWRTGRFLVNK